MPMNDPQILHVVDRLVATAPLLSLGAERPRQAFPLTRLCAEGPRYFRLEVRVDDALAREHSTPSQYITLKLPQLDPRFFVIATAPGETTWGFLIDQESTVGQALVPLPLGTPLGLSEPEGRGFDPNLLLHRPVIAFATGSGVATMVPLFHTLLKMNHPPSLLTLYYGEDDPRDVAYAQTLEAWQALGLRIHTTYAGHPKAWRYVQDAFLADPVDLERAHVVLGGSPAMIRAVATMMLERGFSAQRLLLNL